MNSNKKYSPATLCVQAGWTPAKGEPRVLPIYQSTTFKYDTSEQMARLFDLEDSGYFYTRLQNPTNDAVAAKIAALTKSYIENPPAEMDGTAVAGLRVFSAGTMVDAEGDPIPAEKMLFIDLADGRSFAVRPSGTEPKIKAYLFTTGATREDAEAVQDKLAVAAKESLLA